MRVDVKKLRELKVCEEQIVLFKRFLGDRKYVLDTERNLKLAEKYGLYVNWFLNRTRYFSDIIDLGRKEGVDEKILLEIKDILGDRKVTGLNFSKALIGAFVWFDTPQNHKYWSDIHDKYNKCKEYNECI